MERAQAVNRRLAEHIDVMIGNEEDFTACLGLEVEGADENLSELETGSFRAMIERATQEFPNFAVVATTLRTVRSATVNDWSAIAWSHDDGVRRGDPATRAGDPRPRRRRRQLCLRPDLRPPAALRPAARGRIRRRPRRARDDDPGRHLDGEPCRGRGARSRRGRPRAAVT